MAVKILHTNDFHGRLTDSSLPFLLAEREKADFYFDSGDCITAGNLAIPTKRDPVWGQLAQAQITASSPGNRESHILENVVQKKFAGATHPILCGNWFKKNGELKFAESQIIDFAGLKIGVFGVMVPMVTERMASRHASQFIWTQPIKVAQEISQKLRSQVDVLICLSHIGFAQDQKLAATCPEIDLILGGHSHTVLEAPFMVGSTAICQTGSHARFVGQYTWDQKLVRYSLVPWGRS